MTTWFRHHAAAMRQALRQFFKTPGHFFLNILVLSMTLVLPFGGLTLLANIQEVAGRMTVAPEISIFVKPDADREAAKALEVPVKSILNAAGQSATVLFVPKEEALNDLQKKTGMDGIEGILGKNPLPDSYIIRLTGEMPHPEVIAKQIANLKAAFQKLSETDRVQVDSDWTKRVAALINAMKTGLIFLAAVLGIVVIVVTFNTVRLQVLMHIDEITLCWHVGATRAYIRRPFYYMGIFLGLFSGFIALVAVNLCLIPMNRAIFALARLYGSDFRFSAVPVSWMLAFLAGSAALSCLGAILSVNWQLRKIS